MRLSGDSCAYNSWHRRRDCCDNRAMRENRVMRRIFVCDEVIRGSNGGCCSVFEEGRRELRVRREEQGAVFIYTEDALSTGHGRLCEW